MNSGLASNADQPYGGNKVVIVSDPDAEHPAINWLKLIFLVLLTFGLIVSMWEICQAIEHMRDHSVIKSYEAAGGLLLGLFCFYVTAFGVAWYFGSQRRDEIRRSVVEKQIARQKAMEALMQME